jgi:hypothetical protein
MLPNADNLPAFRAQRLSCRPIALHIAINLPNPILPIARGHSTMFRAPMPKASIYKNGHPLFREHKIRSSENRRVPSPAFQSRGAKQFEQN